MNVNAKILNKRLAYLISQYIKRYTIITWETPQVCKAFLFFFSLLLERKGGRETSMQERSIDWLPLVSTWTRDCMCPDWGSKPQP